MINYFRHNIKSIPKISLKRKLGLLAIIQLFTVGDIFSQVETDFGQYMLFHPTVNIASAGSYYDPTLAIYGRNQWASIAGSPKTLGADFLYPLKQNAIGATIKQESIGVHSKQTFLPYFTHKITVAQKKQLAFGLGVGAEVIQSRFSEVITPDLDDGVFTQDKSAVGALIGFGTYFFAENYYAGFSIPSIVYNDISYNDGSLSKNSDFGLKYWQYNFMGGYEFFINQITDLNVSSLVKLTSNTKPEIDISAQITLLDQLGAGVSYRSKREVLFLVNYNFNNFVKAGYCYHSYFGINGHLLSGQELIFVIRLAKAKMATIQTPRF